MSCTLSLLRFCLIQWYNILVNNGITDFETALAPTEGDNVDDRQEAE